MLIESPLNTWSTLVGAGSYLDAIRDEELQIRANKEVYHNPDFMALVPNLAGQRVLDVGCADGVIDYQLKSRYPTATFIGLDYPNMALAANKGRTQQQRRDLALLGGTSDVLPLQSASIDTVVSSLLFHWISAADETAKEMHRVLRPGGKFVASVVHPDYFKTGRFLPTGIGNEYEFHRTSDVPAKPMVVTLGKAIKEVTYYPRTVGDYGKLFSNAGFSNVTVHAPLFTNPEGLRHYPFLNKYTHHPLHLFVTGSKPRSNF